MFDFTSLMLAAIKGIAAVLGTVTYGALFHTTERGHWVKRSALVAAIVTGGDLTTVRTNARKYATAPLRAEAEYTRNTGDASYFRTRDGKAWAPWASPLIDADKMRATFTDEQVGDAYERAIPLNAGNVAGMCAEISVIASKRNVAPVPVFSDVRKTGTVAPYNAKTHADNYASEGFGGTYTLATPKPTK